MVHWRGHNVSDVPCVSLTSLLSGEEKSASHLMQGVRGGYPTLVFSVSVKLRSVQ